MDEGNVKLKKTFPLLVNKSSIKNIFPLIINNSEYYEHFQDPILECLNSLEDINTLLELNIPKILEFFFFTRKKITKILYAEDEVIQIKFGINKELSFYFYLYLLIYEDTDIIYYKYCIDFIREIDKKNKNTESELTKLILSKLSNGLIINFRETDEYQDEYESELNNIESSNNKIISENFHFFKNINMNIEVDEFNENKIDIIYADIIKSLIKNKKIDNFEYIVKIMEDLDIKNINITEIIYKEISNILNDDIINEYKINTKDDFNIETKINFYYILLKYIFHNSLYIYNLTLFNDARKLIINLLKNNEAIYNKNLNFSDKIKYVIKKLVDVDYFLNSKKDMENLKIVLNYYKTFFFESKKDDIREIEEIIQNNKQINEKFLNDYEQAEKMSNVIPVIKFIFEEKNKLEGRTEKEMKKAVELWEKLEKMIREMKVKIMKKNEKLMIFKYFKEENNKNILINIFGPNIYDNFFIKINKEVSKPGKEKKENKNETKLDKNKKEKEIEEEKLNDNININNITKPGIDKKKEKEKEKDFTNKDNKERLDSSSSIKLDDGSTLGSSELFEKNIDLQAPEPSFEKEKEKEKVNLNELPKINLYDLSNFLTSKCKISFHTSIKREEPYIIYNQICFGEKEVQIKDNAFKQYKDELYNNHSKESNELFNNLRKFFEFLKEIENILIKEFLLNYMLKIDLELIREDKNINNDNIYNITALYTFYEPLHYKKKKYKDENVFINGTNSLLQGFQFMLYDINNEMYEEIKYNKEINYINIEENEELIENNNNIIINFSDEYSLNNSKYCIIEYVNTIGKMKYSADYIKELSNGYLIVGSQNIIAIYDHKLNEKHKITRFKDWVYNICERTSFKEKSKNGSIQVICCMNSKLVLLELEKEKYNFTEIETQMKSASKKKSKKDTKSKSNKNTYNICFEMRENNYIMAGLKGAVYYYNFFGNKGNVEQIKFTEESYRGGLRLSENIVALTSNSVIPGGVDKLIFYNVNTKKIKEGFEGYSFAISDHNLSLIPREEIKSNNKILLCACKKYFKQQKNGILLINPQLGENINIKNPFYDTGFFEVYCFCPILNVINNNNGDIIDDDYKNNIKIEDTDFFFVGGYDVQKREAKIKLYQVIFGEKATNTKIKFLQDIEFNNKENLGFDEQIKCIIQSKINGMIFVTCANGNVHRFTKPNLDFYMEKNKKIK